MLSEGSRGRQHYAMNSSLFQVFRKKQVRNTSSDIGGMLVRDVSVHVILYVANIMLRYLVPNALNVRLYFAKRSIRIDFRI